MAYINGHGQHGAAQQNTGNRMAYQNFMGYTVEYIAERFPADMPKLNAVLAAIESCNTFDDFVKVSDMIENTLQRPCTNQVAVDAMMNRSVAVGVDLLERDENGNPIQA